MKATVWIIRAVIFLALVAVFEWYIAEKRDCEAGGGAYVRGLWWMECVPTARRAAP